MKAVFFTVMSIDLSVVLHPSKKLQILRILFSVCLLQIGIVLACSAPIPVLLKFIFATMCISTALFNYFASKSASGHRWHILIDGQGKIRCKAFSISGQPPSDSAAVFQQTYYLAPGTVIWPQLLLLRLRTLDDDNMINLMILSDAVSTDEFRRLSIACRWIGAKAYSV